MTLTIKIDLWHFPLSLPTGEQANLARTLSDAENQRAARFLSAEHRMHYVIGRARMREILGSYMRLRAGEVPISEGEHGKPAIAGVANPPQFNLSHSGVTAVLAVTADHRIGVDIEAIRPVDDRLSKRFFSPAEAAALTTLQGDAATLAFFRCWTRKEAFVKALGRGMNLPFAAFEVSLLPDADAALKWVDGWSQSTIDGWRLVDFDPGPGLLGAIAIDAQCGDARVEVHARAWNGSANSSQ